MKKSVLIISAAAFVASMFFGCKSANQVYITDYSPVIVAAVYSNSSVPWYDKGAAKSGSDRIDSGGLITSSLNKMLEQNNPEYQSVQNRIDEAADILIHSLEDSGVQVLGNDLLQETSTYKSGFNKFMDKANTSTGATGYMCLDYNGKGRNRVIAKETGAKGTVFAEFIFQKEKMQSGFTASNVHARVTMKIYVADENGAKVLYKTYVGVSSENVPYNNGNWDRNMVVSYFPTVIQSVVNQFILDFTGNPLLDENLVDAEESQEETEEQPQGTSLSFKKSSSAETVESPVGPTHENLNIPVYSEEFAPESMDKSE